jgi:hypothetical protein
MQHFDHDIGFSEKRQFFCLKLSQIAENCDHNIDPWSHWPRPALEKKLASHPRCRFPPNSLEQVKQWRRPKFQLL